LDRQRLGGRPKSMRGARAEALRSMHALIGAVAGTGAADRMSRAELLTTARANTEVGTLTPRDREALRQALDTWDRFPTSYRRAVRRLLAFVSWNLLVILA
jgi:hypothetical protein